MYIWPNIPDQYNIEIINTQMITLDILNQLSNSSTYPIMSLKNQTMLVSTYVMNKH
jgi:hypothetical protein